MDPDQIAAKVISEEPTGEKFKVRCRFCRANTNHIALKSILAEQPYDQDSTVTQWQRYQIIQCQGCDSLALLAIDGDSNVDPNTGKPFESWEVFPNWTTGRRLIEGEKILPRQLRQVYMETMAALNRGQPIICGMGIRAVIETVAKDQKAKGTNLQRHIDDLVRLNVLTEGGAKVLHKLRILGNKAAHEVKAHKTEELALAMDVVEHLLAAVYTLPSRLKRLKQ